MADTIWLVNSSQETPYLSDFLECPTSIGERPKTLWMVSETQEVPYKYNFLETPTSITEFPNTLWVVDNEDTAPYKQFFDIEPLGAFCHATNLTNVIIPQSVKKIGRYSFTNTALASVTIASDCSYFPTSFPEGCVINFY